MRCMNLYDLYECRHPRPPALVERFFRGAISAIKDEMCICTRVFMFILGTAGGRPTRITSSERRPSNRVVTAPLNNLGAYMG